jgi:hypothetical protein
VAAGETEATDIPDEAPAADLETDEEYVTSRDKIKKICDDWGKIPFFFSKLQ